MTFARLGIASLISVLAVGCAEDGPDVVRAPGATIQEVAVYQGIKTNIVGGDNAVDIPVVAGREALVRVFATGGGDYNGGPVMGRLTLATPDGESVEFDSPISNLPGQVDEPSLTSTINFWLPADAITDQTAFRLDLLQETSEADYDNPEAGYPLEENLVADFGAAPATKPLEIVLVPVVNQGRNPDISDEQVERYRQGFMDQYPATQVNISVREPVEFDQALTPGGGGWSQLLNSMSELRTRDGAGPEVYYYGIFAPAERFEQYCTGGCILGLGFVPGVGDSFMRVAIGLGYTGKGSVDTAVHEIGHTHGRQHAPCGVDRADPAFPHSGASIGTWGLSLAQRELKDPTEFTDFMGYCRDTWVSDYTYKALYERMRAVDGLRIDGSPRTYGRYHVGPSGEIEELSAITLTDDITMRTSFRAQGMDGDELEARGHFVPYDHIDGGVLLVPERLAGLQITDFEQPVRLR